MGMDSVFRVSLVLDMVDNMTSKVQGAADGIRIFRIHSKHKTDTLKKRQQVQSYIDASPSPYGPASGSF